MIIVTGAAGFIGSCLVGALNQQGFNDLILVDDFSNSLKSANYNLKKYKSLVPRESFVTWLKDNAEQVELVFHLGARTDTTEFDINIFNQLNLNFSKDVWKVCTLHQIPLIYASSAATYGDGKLGYEDSHEVVPKLKPLNPYGDSKNDFDKWVIEQEESPYFWAGLKFFNVYGPNEYHKSRMASVIFHAFHQIKDKQEMKLFRSHHPDFKDGEQLRDFVYVKDVVKVALFLMQNRKHSGLYNLGTGEARTFLDLVKAVFNALEIKENIGFIDTPIDIRDKYQYFTQANMTKLKNIGYDTSFYTLEEGVEDYVKNYLVDKNYF